MRRKTYAPNAIIIGVLIGIAVYATTESIVLTILAAVGVSVVGWILISLIEKAISRGVDAAAAGIKKGIENKKEKANAEKEEK